MHRVSDKLLLTELQKFYSLLVAVLLQSLFNLLSYVVTQVFINSLRTFTTYG